jgi:MFS family permease
MLDRSIVCEQLSLLVAGRVAQAIFGAALIPVTRALIRLVTPSRERGRNFGLQEALIGVGAASGPLIGGVVIDFSGWPGVFLINVPMVVVAIGLLVSLPADDRTSRSAVADVSRSPMRLILTERSFGIPFVSQAAAVLAQYSLLLTVPVVLDGRGWSSTQVGAALILLTVGMVVSGPVGGRIGDAKGRRFPAVAGMTLAITGISLAAVAIESTPSVVLVGMAAFGLGFGLAVPNLTTSALEAAPDHMAGSASGVWSMSRNFGSIPASLLFAALLGDGANGAQLLLVIGGVAMILAIAAAARMDDAHPAVELGSRA